MNTQPNLVHSQDVDEAALLLDALDQMQIAWMNAFMHRPELLHTYGWNVCKTLWRERDSGKLIEKNEVIGWRKAEGQKAILGENNARKIVDGLIEDGFLEKYDRPDQPRVIFVRATPKLYSALEEIFAAGVVAAKEAFGK